MKISNLTIYTTYASIWQFGSALLGPFLVVFMQKVGGSIENLGSALALFSFVYAVVAYFGGRYSDKFGRKSVLIAVLYMGTIGILAYSFVQTLEQLYILQIFLGATSAIAQTVDAALIGDITRKAVRGTQIGKINAILGIISSVAFLLGGYFIGKFGYTIIFYIVAGISFVGTTVLFWIKEDERK